MCLTSLIPTKPWSVGRDPDVRVNRGRLMLRALGGALQGCDGVDQLMFACLSSKGAGRSCSSCLVPTPSMLTLALLGSSSCIT